MDYKNRFNTFKKKMERAKYDQTSLEKFLLVIFWLGFEVLPIGLFVWFITYGCTFTPIGEIIISVLTVMLFILALALTEFILLYRESKKYEEHDGYWIYWIK